MPALDAVKTVVPMVVASIIAVDVNAVIAI
jgi:hypothetical protein